MTKKIINLSMFPGFHTLFNAVFHLFVYSWVHLVCELLSHFLLFIFPSPVFVAAVYFCILFYL
uniref:Uncharacterized protein n=1 Tax=Populus trichocarpa TaxID=3694 RepID=A9P860_POPTR|nr:unknown [Populus trichocarpa]